MILFDLNGSLMPIHFFNYQFLSHAPISKASFRAIYQNVKIVLQTNQQNEMNNLQYLDDVDPLLTLISDICCMRRKYFCLPLQHFGWVHLKIACHVKVYHGLFQKEVGEKGKSQSGRISKQTKIRITSQVFMIFLRSGSS